ncbi:TPA: hypothetical protein JBF03_10790 [Legionella pneumophila]|jgi:hypothetical protein|nr:hypothetical protein [Legionella pneumophila]HAU1915547.1 hypothetical protein [Legionella pneumophila]
MNLIEAIEKKVDIEQSINQGFKDQEHLFKVLRGELIGCARKIKLFSIIAQFKADKPKLNHEPFWGWLQMDSLAPAIMLSCYKLKDQIHEYLFKFLIKVVPREVVLALKKHSQLKRGVGALTNEAQKFEQFRNKRAAHLDCEHVEPVIFDMKILYDSLVSIDLSLSYISHFLLNPHLLVAEQWNAFNVEGSQDLDGLEDYFNSDYAVTECLNILNRLHS